MKFSNDTRFQSIDSASVLSDLVIEKMLKTEQLSKMTSNMYSEAIEDAAQKIVDAMTTDIHKLFFKPWTKQ